MDIDKLSQKLSSIKEKNDTIDKTFEKIEDNIGNYEKIISFLRSLPDEYKEYLYINSLYQQYISQYSKEYIEMSEYYYGEYLPYDIYCREFKKDQGTYLESKKDIQELYFLFMFYGLLSIVGFKETRSTIFII